MSKKTLYLHIGTNKTGTTTIQRFMAMNRAKLSAQGIFYPQKGSTSGGNHSMFARDLQRQSDGKIKNAAVWESFLALVEQSACEHTVVSGEVFWSFKGGLPYFNRLRDDLLAHFDSVKVVCYLRRQDAYLRSCYLQAIKSGRSSRTFDDYKQVIALTKKRRAYEYHESLSLWADAFGRDNLCIRPFERGQLHPDGLVADFCEQCDIDISSLDEDKAKDVNISPGRRVMAAMLYAQTLLPPMQGTGLRARRQTALCTAMAVRLANEWKGHDEPFKGFAAGEAKAFYELFAEGNNAIARDYLKRKSGRLFNDMTFIELSANESDAVTLEASERKRVEALVDELITQLPDAAG